ncbi:MAG: LLM class F420-dependent oxidoreductase [Propionibacteriaceae bacterium]
MPAKELEFGLFVPQGWKFDLVGIDPSDHWETMLGVARKADEGPFDSIWVYDHLHTSPNPTQEATHEAWSLMAAFAASTERVRLGQMCTCIAYRNPAYLAKVAATVDVISGGRAIMGIGAGWYEHEWRAYGYGFPEVGDRLGALHDGVRIMAALWQDGQATFEGKYYSVDGAICQPKPLQEGGIPMWIAGGGEKRTLKYVAKYGAACNIGGDVDTFKHKLEVLRGHCEKEGRDPAEITVSANFAVMLADTEEEAQRKVQEVEDRASAAGAEQSVLNVAYAGTSAGLVSFLSERVDAGLEYPILIAGDAAYDSGTIDRLSSEVIPALKG